MYLGKTVQTYTQGQQIDVKIKVELIESQNKFSIDHFNLVIGESSRVF
jgi:hypothetical protein